MVLIARLTVLALLALPLLLAQAQQVAKSTKITGELIRDDPLDEKLKHPSKVHEFKMGQGQMFVIRLKSTDFDAYLIVRNSNNTELAFNNDDSDGPALQNSKLVFNAPKDDAYKIVVTSFDNKVGKYELTIDAVTEEQVLAAGAKKLHAEGFKNYQAGKLNEALKNELAVLEIYRKIYPKSRFPEGHSDLAFSLNNVGFLFKARGEFSKAEPFYRDALVMAMALYPKNRYPKGHAALALSMDNLGELLRSQGEYAKAEPFLRDAVAMRQALYPKNLYPQGHSDLAISLNNLGLLLRERGEYAKAEPYLRDALAMREALYPKARYPQGHPDVAISLSNLGSLFESQGDFTKAEPFFRNALAMFQVLYPKGHPELAFSMSNLGALLSAQGEYAKAEPHYREALAMLKALYPKSLFPHGHPDLAVILNNLGALLQSQGEHTKAEPYYLDALAMNQALYPKDLLPQGHPDLAGSLINVGDFFNSQGDYAKAEPYFRDALAMMQTLYPKDSYSHGHPDLARSLNNLGSNFQSQGNYAKAEACYRDALAMRQALYPKDRFPQGHPHLAVSLNNLGCFLHSQGDYARAEPYYRDALAMRHVLYPKDRFPQGHPELAGTLSNLGALLQAQGEYAKAELYAHDALAMQQLYVDRLAEIAAEAQALNFAASLPLLFDAFLSVHSHLPEDAAAYDLIWKSRAQLTRILQRRHLDMHASQDSAAKPLALELQSARQRLAHLLLSPAKDATVHKKKLDELTDAKEDLEKRLASQLRLILPTVAAQTSPQQLSNALPENTAFVDLIRFTYDSQAPAVPDNKGKKWTPRFMAFVLLSGKPAQRVDLGEAAPIEKAWANWREAIVNNRPNPQAAGALATLLWLPLRKHLPANTHTVWLAPDGQLAQVPWAALPGAKPNTILLEELALAVVPHGAYLLQHLQDKPAGLDAKATLLTVGGVAYEQVPTGAAAIKDLTLVPTEKFIIWPALPGTASELAQIAGMARKVFKTEPVTLQGATAGFAQVSAELPKARFAHLATHGFFADPKFRSAFQIDEKQFLHLGSERKTAGARSPLVLSGLVLAGANRPETPERGIMTAEAVVGLRLEDLELAVLSACETGLGESAGGEGVFGLQRAFHVAGAHNVIASLWRVDDKATAALMVLFYHKLWLEKRPPLQALREAQLTLYRHPEAISDLAGERGPVNQAATVKLVSKGESAPAAGKTTPVKLWAAFCLSGVGQ